MASDIVDSSNSPNRPPAAEEKSEESQNSPTNKSATPAPPKSTIWDKLPPWVSANLRSNRARKMWLRCWIASWAAFIIILPNKSLSTLGNAAFFSLLASFMIPANMPVQLFLFALSTMVVGMCLGWGLGAAAMRAALASRNQLVLKQSLLREQQSVAGLSNPDALFQADIFAGKFLDTRSTVVFGCFLGLGSFFFALIRAYAPKLIIMSVFGTVTLDIFCSYGPLFPFGEYTIVNSLLISVASYIAIGIVLITFVFPETVNHAALIGTSDLIGKLKNILDIQQRVLDSSQEDLVTGQPLANKLQAARAGILAQIQQVIASTKFIGGEFSWGKWNGDDITALHEPLMSVVSRTSALHSFAKLVGHPRFTGDSASEQPSEPSDASSSSVSNVFSGDTYLLRQLRERNNATEAQHSVRVADLLPVIEDATSDLRNACSAGLASVKTLLDGINSRRYARKGATESQQQLADLDQAIERLNICLAEFKEHKRLILVEPFQSLLQSADTTKGPMPLRSLYVAYVFAANLVVLASAILKLMETVQATAAKRTKNRLWMPGGLRALAKAIVSRGETSDQAAGEDNVPQAEEEVKKEECAYKLDPDSRPPTNALQRAASTIHSLYKWCKTPEALFTAKYVILTIVLWIPAICHRSAHFIYAEKGLWALIMAQTTLNIFASDQIFNYVARILGTFFGAVFGLLAWYIGSAKSNGSPYGSAAVMAVFLVPLTFIRLFSPPQYLPGVLLFVVTYALIMGYSWIDGHLPVVGNPGIGWPIAWKRFVQVMIGCAASFIFMMLPPKSGRKAVRLRNSATITSLSFLYRDIVAAWISSEETSLTEKHISPAHSVEWIPGFRDRLLAVAAQLQAVKVQTMIAKWEGSIRGAWPGDEYMKMANVQTEMISSLALLGGALSQVDSHMRLSFLQYTRVVNPNFIADVMATFSLVSQALRTGEPFPQALRQNLFDRLHYHGNVGHRSLATGGDVTHEALHRDHLNAIMRYEYMFYATAVSAVFQMLDGLNELREIATRLCGEVPLQGFARWKDEYDRAHVLA